MSADNGIYIAEFPLQDGSKEYRVAHCQNIENVARGDSKMEDAYRILYFGHSMCPLFARREDASDYANMLSQEYDILEYGICDLIFDRPLASMTMKEAEEVLLEDMRKTHTEVEPGHWVLKSV